MKKTILGIGIVIVLIFLGTQTVSAETINFQSELGVAYTSDITGAGTAVLVTSQPGAWNTELQTCGAWIWSESPIQEGRGISGDVVTFEETFTLPVGYFDAGLSLRIAADNEYRVYLNGTKIADSGWYYQDNIEATSDSITSAGPHYRDDKEYNHYDDINVNSGFIDGENILEIKVLNLPYYTDENNPGGVIYCGEVSFSAAKTFDLCAGQTTNIGNVQVWNDCDNIYVKFDTDETLLESHVHVATSLNGIPHTKKGNPIPGQFAYSKHYPELHEYTIPLTWQPGTTLYIAAHAATGVEECVTIVSGDGQTMVTRRRSGNDVGFTTVGTAAVRVDEPDPYPSAMEPGDSDTGLSTWDNSLSGSIDASADWIWESTQVLDPVDGTVLTFERTFDIGYPISGSLEIACDNGYEAFLNGLSLGSGNVYGSWQTSNLTQAYVDTSGWQNVGDFNLISLLAEGTNTLAIDAANEQFDNGTALTNPGGLIFSMNLCHYTNGETAWGDGCSESRFPGANNWGTYFTYEVTDCAD